MTLIAKNKGGSDFKPAPAGTHVAICNLVADMGVQPTAKYAPRHQVYVRWELPNEIATWKDAAGKEQTGPMMIGQKYTMSLSEKANLRADLESWRGRVFTEAELRGFDIKNILGKPCMLGIAHNVTPQKTYATISAVMGLTKGVTVPPPSVTPIAYDIDAHDPAVFAQLPAWLQEAINGRIRSDKATTVAAEGDFDDDIPF